MPRSCETCGGPLVGLPCFFIAPLAEVCEPCFRSGMTLYDQLQAMHRLGIDTRDAARWPRNMEREVPERDE